MTSEGAQTMNAIVGPRSIGGALGMTVDIKDIE